MSYILKHFDTPLLEFNFKFKRHSRYNLDKKRLRIIERFIQVRVQEILGG